LKSVYIEQLLKNIFLISQWILTEATPAEIAFWKWRITEDRFEELCSPLQNVALPPADAVLAGQIPSPETRRRNARKSTGGMAPRFLERPAESDDEDDDDDDDDADNNANGSVAAAASTAPKRSRR
jgi:hypothetical protein